MRSVSSKLIAPRYLHNKLLSNHTRQFFHNFSALQADRVGRVHLVGGFVPLLNFGVRCVRNFLSQNWDEAGPQRRTNLAIRNTVSKSVHVRQALNKRRLKLLCAHALSLGRGNILKCRAKIIDTSINKLSVQGQS